MFLPLAFIGIAQADIAHTTHYADIADIDFEEKEKSPSCESFKLNEPQCQVYAVIKNHKWMYSGNWTDYIEGCSVNKDGKVYFNLSDGVTGAEDISTICKTAHYDAAMKELVGAAREDNGDECVEWAATNRSCRSNPENRCRNYCAAKRIAEIKDLGDAAMKDNEECNKWTKTESTCWSAEMQKCPNYCAAKRISEIKELVGAAREDNDDRCINKVQPNTTCKSDDMATCPKYCAADLKTQLTGRWTGTEQISSFGEIKDLKSSFEIITKQDGKVIMKIDGTRYPTYINVERKPVNNMFDITQTTLDGYSWAFGQWDPINTPNEITMISRGEGTGGTFEKEEPLGNETP